MTDYSDAIIEIGGRGSLGDETLHAMAKAPAMVHRQSPKASILLSIGGYDDDPRELWEIPEAVDYLRRFAVLSGLSDWRTPVFQALHENSKALLIRCEVVARPHPYRVAP